MALALDIALTHLAARTRQTLVSVLGVAMGVGFFVAMSAMMQGFQQDFVNKIVDNTPYIVIKDEFRTPPRQPARIAYADAAIDLRGLKPRDEIRGIKRAGQILKVVSDWPGVAAASPTLQGQLFLRYGGKEVSVSSVGIDPERERRVTKLEKDIKQGSLDALKTTNNGIIVGAGVARKLGAEMHSIVTAVSPKGVILRMKIVGLIQTGIVQIDDSQAYLLLKKSQILQQRINVVNQIRIKTTDLNQAHAIARQIENRFDYKAESWEESNAGVFGVFVIQNAVMYSTTGAILIVACFGIFNIISTVIFEKTRDIAILKSIGFEARDIRRIFLLEGFAVGLIGSLLGCALGFALTHLLGAVRFDIKAMIETKGFVLKWSVWHYVIASAMAMASAVLAAYLPARRAAGVNPVTIIRGAA